MPWTCTCEPGTPDAQEEHGGEIGRFPEVYKHFDTAERTPQSGGEMGWILESNQAINRAMEGMRGRIVRTYRVYEKIL